MKRFVTGTMMAAALAWGFGAAAQSTGSGQTGSGQTGSGSTTGTSGMSQSTGSQRGEVTVTGCLQKSADGGYELTDVTGLPGSSSSMSGTSGTSSTGSGTGTSSGSTSGTGATSGTGSSSYGKTSAAGAGERVKLSGKTDELSDHVGHKIEVRGTMAAASTSGTGSTSGTSGTAGTAGSTSSAAAKNINVQSVRMISQDCK